MKNKIGLFIAFALLIAIAPALSLINFGGGTAHFPAAAEKDPTAFQGIELIVLDEGTDKLLTLSERDYAIGAVMSEMPASYEVQALEAQAIACRSYARHIKALRDKEPLKQLKGGVFAINTAKLEGYISPDQAKARFGSSYAKYSEKITAAVDETIDEILTFDGAPIAACYHAISPGKTENSENVFTSALPYLVSVDSSFDTTAKGYESAVKLPPAELEDMIRTADSSFKTSGDPSTWLGTLRASEAGTVLELELCSRKFTGPELRKHLNLRSAAFSVEYSDNAFVFTVHGYGHGVGMSQNGANELAKRGADHAAILAHYYKGAELTSPQ
ncbi:MAG: stage II sporulation protein D [Oscillospiraceae bacterium]